MNNNTRECFESMEQVPPNLEAIKLVNRVLDQNDRILAMNATLLKVASFYSMAIVGTITHDNDNAEAT